MGSVHEVIVDLGERSYPIRIGSGVLAEVGTWLARQPGAPQVLIVTNEAVNSRWGEALRSSIKAAGLAVETVAIADGEEHKNLATLSMLYDRAIAMRLERSATVLALGGGIVGDVAGFFAATYMRGTGFVQVPTTLLAQVDSSVGGKTAVNHQAGKNLIGAFYQPQAVFIDTDTLSTLPKREVAAGYAEVVKTAMLGDAELFQLLERDQEKLLALDPAVVATVVARCCAVKARVVGADERERGLRALLNLGHTFGHAVEALTEYRRYKHGEAVAIGLVAACRLAETVLGLNRAVTERVTLLLTAAGLPVSFPCFARSAWSGALQLDKKVAHGNVLFVLVRAIGDCVLSRQIPLENAIDVIMELQEKSS
ncbi:3-dehydroquinate synthase [Heliophilum fasciatum]|uniref:3-dehydroquinate synthase n=1 Tax=Heliophilum fasciatum TaxID=35700 RepID=A0A4R2S7D2_9FIRM|nr:3-dehydroquinate synthase [Heliophilum fasciatum]MCW2277308.1 3-dehydroquinate synthase [Heliophilum fasciatum]TCP67145.1 3-dehydroquinate synthase [Heliophilum fasciatum]